MTKKRKRILLTDLAILAAVAVALAISMAFSRSIELALGLAYYVDAETGERVERKTSFAMAHAEGTDAAAELRVHFLDVGQGDCTIIEFPDGKTMLIDGGEYYNSVRDYIIDYIETNLPSDFEYFDYAILTHADRDHCGSMDDVLGAYPARVFYRPNVEATGNGYSDPGKAQLTQDAEKKDTDAYKKCIEAGYRANAEFTPRGVVTDPDDATQTVYGGSGDNIYTFYFYSPLSDTYNDSNDYSPIMILNYRGFMFAMSGDAEKKNEAEFVQKTIDARTDGVDDKYDLFTDDFTVNVVKTGHHGSRTSTSQAYLDVITTEEGASAAYYIISCGEDNRHGHPHAETLTRLEDMNVPGDHILRTDESGDLTFSVKCDADGVYKLFYGGAATSATAGVLPVLPTGVIPEPEPEPEPDGDNDDADVVLVYLEFNGIKLTWAVTAWSCYAALVVLAAIHAAFTAFGGKSSAGGSRGRNKRR